MPMEKKLTWGLTYFYQFNIYTGDKPENPVKENQSSMKIYMLLISILYLLYPYMSSDDGGQVYGQ